MSDIRRLRRSPRGGLGEAGADETVSSRGKQTPEAPGLYAPGVPEGAARSAFQFFTPKDVEKFKAFTPEQAEELARIIERGLQSAFDRFSLYTQAKPFDDYNIAVVPCAANVATRLDGPAVAQGMPSRRALLIINTNVVAANVLHVGKANIAIGAGIPVLANFGSYLSSVHERNPHYGIIAANTNIVVVWYS